MKLTKTIKIKSKDSTLELNIKREGPAQCESQKFKKDFDYLIDSILITLLKNGYHYSEVESK